MSETQDMFSGFDEDELLIEEQAVTGTGTLIKIFSTDTTNGLKVGYITSGNVEYLRKMQTFLIEAEMSQYTSKEAVGAYSAGVIDDMKRTISNSYKVLENEVPTNEEVKSAWKFNEAYKQYAVN